jgi:uncharacterized protein YneF (UPF0154 family)
MMKKISTTRKVFAIILGAIISMSVGVAIQYFLFCDHRWLLYSVMYFVLGLFSGCTVIYLSPRIFPEKMKEKRK